MNMDDKCEVDVYWTVQNGRRFSISLSEQQAWKSLETLYDYSENPEGWMVEHSREKVPTATGEVVEGEGEIVELDNEGDVLARAPYKPVHVFWDCPWCGHRHNTDLYRDALQRRLPYPNPSVWFCENGEGIALVKW
jgi:hypothetical protein